MIQSALTIIHELLCAALFYTVFYRAVRTSKRVRPDIRLAFFGLGLVACAGMAAPFALGFQPDPFELILLAAIVAVQFFTAHHWANDCPRHFYKPGQEPERRRGVRHAGHA